MIDFQEAKNLFTNLREPNKNEISLAKILGDNARIPISASPMIQFLNKEQQTPSTEVNQNDEDTKQTGT